MTRLLVIVLSLSHSRLGNFRAARIGFNPRVPHQSQKNAVQQLEIGQNNASPNHVSEGRQGLYLLRGSSAAFARPLYV